MKLRSVLYILCACFAACSVPSHEKQETVSVLLPNGAEYVELFPVGLDTSQYFIRSMYSENGLVLSGQYFMSFDDSVPQYYRLPFNTQYTDIAWYNGNCFAARDSLLIYIEDDGKEHNILRTDMSIKKIYPIQNGIYFAGDSSIHFYRFSIAEGEPVSLFKRTIEDIRPINEHTCFAAVGNSILLLNDGNTYKVYADSANIRSIDVANDGSLFYATDMAVNYLNPNGLITPIVNKGARQVKIIGNDLFIIHSDNSCFIITNIDLYSHLIQNKFPNESEDSID